MARPSDPAITKRAIGLVARIKKAGLAAKTSEQSLSEWEGGFLDSLEERLEKYGSAFNDPDLGAMNAPLSLRQGLKLMQIKRKTNGKINGKTISKARPQKKPLRANAGLKVKKPLQRKTALRNKLAFNKPPIGKTEIDD